jgi:hypothetical protein
MIPNLLLTTLLFLQAALPAAASGGSTPCTDSLDVAVFVSPRAPHRGAPMRIMAVSTRPIPEARMELRSAKSGDRGLELRRLGGPPWGFVATVERPEPGAYHARLLSGIDQVACEVVRVQRHAPKVKGKRRKGADPIWRDRIKWERDTENLYSLWVEHLFAGPPDADLSWRPLHQVLRDRERNLLHDHHGLGEDEPGRDGLQLKPDCADFPYFLRAYFSFKLGLPFSYRDCNRGTASRAPRCGEILSNEQPSDRPGAVKAFERFARKKVANAVQSSSPRTALKDEQSDFYPVMLQRSALRPGAIFADPYGHIMVVSSWLSRGEDEAGILMAADAQPDGTVGRRIFWKGSFLFPKPGSVSGAGFKRFRPIVRTRKGLAALSNASIQNSLDYGDLSYAQGSMSPDAFYEAVDALITPHALPPARALVATVEALEQQVLRRVASVENCEAYKGEHPGQTIDMPRGAEIFVTTGPWEDYSTPARDMRLLIALDAVKGFPARVERHPQRFLLDEGTSPAQARAAIEKQLAAEAARRSFSYSRSDGSTWKLTLKDVLDRAEAFEMAYNPNECTEIRWSAPEGSEEISTCQKHAPASQRDRMARYRQWFKERRRPVE